MTTRHALTALKIYEGIYFNSNQKSTKVKKSTNVGGFSTAKLPTKGNLNSNSKKEEIIQSLNYLKSKQIKSKQDKSSISMLEGLIASMK